jgi:thioredoxin reductase
MDMDPLDVVVVGGGPAGLSAALLLGRSRRRTLLLDGGEGRNAPSHAAHSFLTRDGISPAELRRIGREQLGAYPSVEVRDVEATDATAHRDGFGLTLAGGVTVATRRIVLATSVRDVPPAIPGLPERYGRSVFHCPYCHGWEVRDQPLAVLAEPDMAEMHASLIRNWSRDLVLLTHGDALAPDAIGRLEASGIVVRTDPIAHLDGEEGDPIQIHLVSGETIERAALFIRPALEPRTALAQRLGCELVTDGMVPGLIRVDERQETTVPGVYAAGDVATPMQQIATAVASGATAGAMVNHSLVAEEYARDTAQLAHSAA